VWVFLNDAFLSIVQPPAGDPKDRLLVRGRVKGDLERVFPKAKVSETANHDYRFRTLISRQEVAIALTREVMALNYPNFKGSVIENDRHDAYMGCWSSMNGLQRSRLAPPKPAKGRIRPWIDDDLT